MIAGGVVHAATRPRDLGAPARSPRGPRLRQAASALEVTPPIHGVRPRTVSPCRRRSPITMNPERRPRTSKRKRSTAVRTTVREALLRSMIRCQRYAPMGYSYVPKGHDAPTDRGGPLPVARAMVRFALLVVPAEATLLPIGSDVLTNLGVNRVQTAGRATRCWTRSLVASSQERNLRRYAVALRAWVRGDAAEPPLSRAGKPAVGGGAAMTGAAPRTGPPRRR